MASNKLNNLVIENARIMFRNFKGEETRYNAKGNRNFCGVIDSKEQAEALAEDGWNIKVKPPREEGEEPFITLPVKIKFSDRGPKVYLKTGEILNELDEESIGCLDNVDIIGVDMDIRPYDWEVNGKMGRTAYLHAICVSQEIDRFADRDRYSDIGHNPQY